MEAREIIVSKKKQLDNKNVFKFHTLKAKYICGLGSKIKDQEKKNLYYHLNVIMSTSDDDDDATELSSEHENIFLRKFRKKFPFVVDDVKLDLFLIKLYQQNITIIQMEQSLNIVDDTEDNTYGFEDAEFSKPPWKLVVKAETKRSLLSVVLIPEKLLSLDKFEEKKNILATFLKGYTDKKRTIGTNITKFNKRDIIARFNKPKTDKLKCQYDFDHFLIRVRKLDFKIKNILFDPLRKSENKKKKKKKKYF